MVVRVRVVWVRVSNVTSVMSDAGLGKGKGKGKGKGRSGSVYG